MSKRVITIMIGLVFIVTTLLLNIEQVLKIQIILVFIVFTLIFAYGIDYKRYQKVNPKKLSTYQKYDNNNNEYKICTVCNTKNKSSNTFCYKCQSSLESIICPVCEHVNAFDQKYCSNCKAILQNKRRH